MATKFYDRICANLIDFLFVYAKALAPESEGIQPGASSASYKKQNDASFVKKNASRNSDNPM